MDLHPRFPRVPHNLSDFVRRASVFCAEENSPEFIKFALTGEYDEEGVSQQVMIDVARNRVRFREGLTVSRDYDSAIGVTNSICVDAPITVWAVPHPTYSLKSSIHLSRRIVYQDVVHRVPYHHIPNFEFGNFGTRHQLNIFFPKLWKPELQNYAKPSHVSERNRGLWYKNGLRPAIDSLLGMRVASDWPASLETEKLRASKSRGGQPAWSQKVIPKEVVPFLAETIRQQIIEDIFLEPEDIEWASTFFIMHTIRGVKHAHFHGVSHDAAEYYLTEFIRDCRLLENACDVGEWWFDVGIEVSSDDGHCLQWATGGHKHLVEEILRIPEDDAIRITSCGSSKYSRDLASHLSAVSGFRVEPGPQAEGEFQAAYVQAYTTDKAVVYNVEGRHHAKFLTVHEAMQPNHPSKTITGLYDIYEQAKEANSSNARLEVRVPCRYATSVLLAFDSGVIRDSLYSFTRDEWWDFRLIRILAISQAVHLQATGPSHHRFSEDALALTASCVWLLNGLHARPDDGPASRELMDISLPRMEASRANDVNLAYNMSTGPNNHRLVAHIPFGCVFFRQIKVTTTLTTF